MDRQTPAYLESEEYLVRSQKVKEIEGFGVDPYPHAYAPSHSVDALTAEFEKQDHLGSFEDAQLKNSPSASIRGRLVLLRPMGKNIFAHVQDGSKRVQVLFNRGSTKVEGLHPDADITDHKFLEKKLDLGDIIGVEGNLFRTNKGELTLFTHKATLLCKAVLPLPDKHSGLKDKETRYRKRYLDLIANPEVMETFKIRSRIVHVLRNYFVEHGFLEVETPILERLYGGAQAKPFKTHHNSLNMEMFMRIALEIPLKKLIVGGIDRVFEIGRLFRNEGIDATHNPEFTSIEAYAANLDYKDVMKLTEELFATIARDLFNTTKIGKRMDRAGVEHDIDVQTPWKRVTMKDSLQEYAQIDFDQCEDAELKERIIASNPAIKEKVLKASRGELMVLTFEEFVEHKLIQPTFITDYPIESTPLCKPHRDPKARKEGLVERFEAFALGTELANAYSELNDPVLQRELLEKQDRLLTDGDEEASPIDEDFLEAICQGMPPCGGLGIGVDRMVMLFTGKTSIRDVLFFPMMRAERQEGTEKEEQGSE